MLLNVLPFCWQHFYSNSVRVEIAQHHQLSQCTGSVLAESSNSMEVYLPAVLTVSQPHIYLYCELHSRQRGVVLWWSELYFVHRQRLFFYVAVLCKMSRWSRKGNQSPCQLESIFSHRCIDQKIVLLINTSVIKQTLLLYYFSL